MSSDKTVMGNFCCCKRRRTKIGSRPSIMEVDPSNYVNMSPEKDMVNLNAPHVVVKVVADPGQDSDSEFVSRSESGLESSVCETLHNIDPAWDTDAGSCHGSKSPSPCSVSSFGSFSGLGCFSDSCSSNMTSDFGSMVTHLFVEEGTE